MTRRKTTDIEQEVKKLLEDLEFFYIREYRFGSFNIDFFLPEFEISIQADGEYWHGFCKKCKTKELTSRQLFRQYKDLACIALHKVRGTSILRFCGCEIKNNKEFVKEVILEAISQTRQGNLVYRNRNIEDQ